MTNETVLSLGIFGRLSILAAPRADVIDRIKLVNHHRERPDASIESENPKAVLAKAFPLLLTELSALVETIVLSDTVIEFGGHDSNFLVDLAMKHQYFGLNQHLTAWYYTQIWADEANALRQRVLGALNTRVTFNSDPLRFEVEAALATPQHEQSFSIMNHAIDGHRLDFNACTMYAGEWARGTDEEERAGWEKLKRFVDEKLGLDWIAYRSVIDVANHWPTGLTVSTQLPPEFSEEWLRWQLVYGLYTELGEALKLSTLSVSGFAAGNYYPFLSSPNKARMHLLKVVSQKYAEVLQNKLKEVGYLCLDLELPPILRLCLKDSATIVDVVDRAVHWRSHPWFIKLRSHLAELSADERPEKLIRQLSRLREHIEASISGFRKGVTTGLAVSSTGSLSLSLPAIGKQLLSWRNPVVYVHSRISKVMGNRDSIGDLARVLDISRTEATEVVRNVDL